MKDFLLRDIEEELHLKIKIQAAKKNKSMRKYILALIEEDLKDKE